MAHALAKRLLASAWLAAALAATMVARAEGAPAAVAPLTAEQIVDRVLGQETFGWAGARARVRMVLSDRHGGQRINVLDVWARRANGRLQTLVRLRAPAETAGMAFLLLESEGGSEQYAYLPSLGKTRRIVGREQRGSFMGSDFTYADLERDDLRGATHKRLPDEVIGDTPTYVIESTITRDSAYSRIQSWVHRDAFLPLRVRFFDRTGALAKTMYARRLQTVDGVRLVREARMQNERDGHATDLVIEDVSKLQGVSADLFTPTALEHE